MSYNLPEYQLKARNPVLLHADTHLPYDQPSFIDAMVLYPFLTVMLHRSRGAKPPHGRVPPHNRMDSANLHKGWLAEMTEECYRVRGAIDGVIALVPNLSAATHQTSSGAVQTGKARDDFRVRERGGSFVQDLYTR